MNEYTTLGVLGFVLMAAGTIALNVALSGPVAGALVCMFWGAFFLYISTLRNR